MLSWFYGLALGAQRFEHFTRYRRDWLLGELLGMKRFCSPDTLRRLFLRFHYREVTEASERLMALLEFRALDSHCLWQACNFRDSSFHCYHLGRQWPLIVSSQKSSLVELCAAYCSVALIRRNSVFCGNFTTRIRYDEHREHPSTGKIQYLSLLRCWIW